VGVNGSGTPGTVPVWTGSGKTLTNSRIQDNGATITMSLPVSAVATGAGPTVAATAANGNGVSGHSSTNYGVVGTTDSTTWQAGVGGFGVQYGVLGAASATDIGWGVKGVGAGNTVGVEGNSTTGVGVRGSTLSCNDTGCTPTAGTAGQFSVGAGGILLQGLLANHNGPGGWEEKFKVDSGGNLLVAGSASKPGGGSWSALSDRRTKTSIAPIDGALNRLLKLRGVTFEYANPAAFGERAGTHVGVVAQDVEKVFPSWVDTGDDGYKRVTFRGFEAVAIEAVRELEAQVAANSHDTTARIAELERQNADLRRMVEALSQAVRTLQNR
jgi:hypothetical protein